MLARFDFSRPRTIVAAALLVGVLAGLAGAAFHSVVTEPRVDEAIALEEAAAARSPGDDHGTDSDDAEDPGEAVTVSRSDQRGVGLFAAYALTGAAFGLFLAITSLSLRTTTGGPFRRVAVSGAVLTGAIVVAPWLKYPPNPPGVGDPDTVGERERLYVLAIVLTALLLAGLAHASARLRRAGWPDDRRVAAVVAAGLVAFGVLFAALPPAHATVSVPANLVWQFRINSLAGNLLMWTLLTVGLGVVWTEAARRESPAAEGSDGQNSMPLSADVPSS